MGKTTEDTAMELQDLIRKECDKRDRKYAQMEDKCNKLEDQVTQKNQQKTMPQRGRAPNHEKPGALKKNKSNQRHTMNQQKTRTKSDPVNNSGPKNRRNPESPGQAAEKNSGSRSKSASKQTSPLQKKLNRNLSNNAGKKKPPRKQQ